MPISITTGIPSSISEICDVDITLPDTLSSFLTVTKRSCKYHITDVLSYKYGNHVKYFGILRMAFVMNISDSFVDDNTNRPIFWNISIPEPKSKMILAGPNTIYNNGFITMKSFHPYIKVDYDNSSDSMYYGGICAINTGRYITGPSYGYAHPDLLAEPTVIEAFTNTGSETRFYLKYLTDNKNVPLKSTSSTVQYGRYNINFEMPLYYSIIDGNFFTQNGPSWDQVEFFRA